MSFPVVYQEPRPLFVGQSVEILPAYEADTKARIGYDEIALCWAEIDALHLDGTVDVRISGDIKKPLSSGIWNVSQRRLKPVRF